MRRRVNGLIKRAMLAGYVVYISFSCFTDLSVRSAFAGDKSRSADKQLTWYDDYSRAMDLAERQGKMLFILFTSANDPDDKCDDSHRFAIAQPEVQEKLKKYVRLVLPVDAGITLDGKEVKLLDLPAYSEMLGSQGMAIIDFASKNANYHGCITSMFPLYHGRAFTPEQIGVMLELPPGTLTQRTLIYAVRTHPERPSSTDGEKSDNLAAEAESHSEYQANICNQGHHRWGFRFNRIRSRLPVGLTATEVCAESWPGEGLLAAAIDCVQSWRQSSGHWRNVRTNHPCYGYDMKRGRNGIWYATGIFGKRQ